MKVVLINIEDFKKLKKQWEISTLLSQNYRRPSIEPKWSTNKSMQR